MFSQSAAIALQQRLSGKNKRRNNRYEISSPVLLAFVFLMVVSSVWMVFALSAVHLHIQNDPLLHFGTNGTFDNDRRRQGRSREFSSVSDQTSNSQMQPQLDLLPASFWATRKIPGGDADIASLLTPDQVKKAKELCGNFVFSSLTKAVQVKDMGEDVFVATGDIDDMWIRDSVVQMTIYLNQQKKRPWLRFLVEGAIRRNAFNILQDPYANAYEHLWKDPKTIDLRDKVIGRGGYVATRNYELDSGAYFLTHLYDYYVSPDIYRPEALLEEPMVFEAVMLMVNTWIVEQNHGTKSPYRYFELANKGKGLPTVYTGMTWSGFRPSDDAQKYGYSIPANIHAAASLERLLILNDRVWHREDLSEKVSNLLRDIEDGISKYGVVEKNGGEKIYAYEVDGLGNHLIDFDDANIPSLLSIPLLGWSGYDKDVYQATRRFLLSPSNPYYFTGSKLKGIGSPHTPRHYVWPMALIVEGLTTEGSNRDKVLAEKMSQLLTSACRDAMHESVHVSSECQFTRNWFEWANALFVIYTEATLGVDCGEIGEAAAMTTAMMKTGGLKHFYSNPFRNDPTNELYYQGVSASVQYETTSG